METRDKLQPDGPLGSTQTYRGWRGFVVPKRRGELQGMSRGVGGGGKILKSEVLARLMYRSCLLSAVTVLSVHLESSAKRTFFTTVSTLNHYVIVRHLCVFFSLY